MKKLLYIGHGHHNKTKSTVFLIDLLKTKYDVFRFDLDPQCPDDLSGLDDLAVRDFDVLVIFQVMPRLEALRKHISWECGAFFPMYDYFQGGVTLDCDVWYEYSELKIINFSSTLHEKLMSCGFDSKYVQYYPDPVQTVSDWGDVGSVYFWQRISSLDLKLVARLLKRFDLRFFHLHKKLDPSERFSPVKAETEEEAFFKRLKMTESTWYETRQEMRADMLKSAVYIAPRPYEGIGMSFLEAMAAGRCVIAPDCPTMNEYIVHGENGLLYEWSNQGGDLHPPAIDPTKVDIREIQRKAYESVKVGHDKWVKGQGDILTWVGQPASPDRSRLEQFAKGIGWVDSPIEEQPRKDVGELKRHVCLIKPVRRDWFFGKPDVTVITVVYNAIKCGRKEHFVQCLRSVQRQRGIRIEHLVVDGGSTDGTVELVRSFVNENVRVRLLSLRDEGIYDGMNRGLALAKGKYVIFLNSDDFYHDSLGLRDSFRTLEESRCDFSYAPVVILDEQTGKPKDHPNAHPKVARIFVNMEFSHQSVMIRREAFMDIHGFDLRYRSAADYDSVLRLILTGHRGCRVSRTFVTFRLGGFSCTNMAKSQRETGMIFSRLYKRYAGVEITPEKGHLMYLSGIVPAEVKEGLFKYYVAAFCQDGKPADVVNASLGELYGRYLRPRQRVVPRDFWEISGLYGEEPWGAWAARRIVIWVRLPDDLRGKDVRADLDIGAFRKDREVAQVTVKANGRLLDVLKVDNFMPERKRIFVPADIVPKSVLKIEVETDETINPAKAGISDDNRNLGLSFAEARFSECLPHERVSPVTEVGVADASCVSGLYAPESWGAWAGRKVEIMFRLPAEWRGRDAVLQAKVGSFNPTGESARGTVSVNGEEVGVLSVAAGKVSEYEMVVPARLTQTVACLVTLSVPKAYVPANEGLGLDERALGIAFAGANLKSKELLP